MFKYNLFRKIAVLLGAISFLTVFGVSAQEDWGTEHIGEAAFLKSCAACHGADGKGTGPILDILKQKPADLTTISKRNGGKYPQQKIYAWIRDPERIRAHGSAEMPIWGEKFSKEIIESYGPYYTGPACSVQARILELVFYIGTIQK